MDEMLGRYLEHSARSAFLESKIQELYKDLGKMRSEIVEDLVSVSPKITGLPGGQKGISDSTGRLGTMVADGHVTPHMEQVIKEIDALELELERVRVTVVFVDAWLKALDEKELFVIKKKTIGGLSWKQLGYLFRNTYGDSYTQQGLRRIRDSAMDKIYKIAE